MDPERQAEFDRLTQLPRRVPTTTTLLGPPLEIADAASFLWTLPDIFERGMLAFRASSATPLIIDGGANIGLATLFFKRLYPRSRILAFEPDPLLYDILCRNLQAWGWSDVACHCAALWRTTGTAHFRQEGADSGTIVESAAGATTQVQTVRLSEYLTEPVDMLKLDIEGAEVDVLEECHERLHWVRHLYVSYHSFKDQPQRLHDVIERLIGTGFRVYPDDRKVPSPLLMRHEYENIESLTGLFGFRR